MSEERKKLGESSRKHLVMPEWLDDNLRILAAWRRITTTELILDALKAYLVSIGMDEYFRIKDSEGKSWVWDKEKKEPRKLE